MSFEEALAARLVGTSIRLRVDDLDALEQYYSLLARWNRRVNLTSLTLQGFPAATLDRLIVEPLLASALVPDETLEWFDLGSGGGSPAIPMCIVRRRAHLVMVEVRERKAAFLRDVVRRLNLASAGVLGATVKEVAQLHPGAADLVTVRALRLDSAMVGSIRQLTSPHGRVFFFGSAEPKLDSSWRTVGHELRTGALLTVVTRV